ncbi:helitron helicase-like domain-containing protein [Artemisia annua]|uniref:Helitron helicase-like domain-containing protein n=1 Tax=Artemisia annua TaxID=35608 RepID=A0A2U1KEX8_ARTAN|nr:helitron helicase-like domain-containing protein [Artemisia annua]
MPRRLLRTEFIDFSNNYMSTVNHNRSLEKRPPIDNQPSLASNGYTIPYNTFATNGNATPHLSSNGFNNRSPISPTSLPLCALNETNTMLEVHGEASHLPNPYGNSKNYEHVPPTTSQDSWDLGNQRKKRSVSGLPDIRLPNNQGFQGATTLCKWHKRKTEPTIKSGFERQKRHKGCSYMEGNPIQSDNAQFSGISSSVSQIGKCRQYDTTMPTDVQSMQMNDTDCHSLTKSHGSFINKGKTILFERTSVDSSEVEPQIVHAGPCNRHSEVGQPTTSDPHRAKQPSCNASTQHIVKVFRTARERISQGNATEFKIQLYNVLGNREYQLPSSGTLGAIVFESGANSQTDYDVIVEYKDRGPQRINKLHSSYMSLQYPLLFVYGQPGFNTKMTLREMGGKKKRKKLSMNMYYKYQLHERFGQMAESNVKAMQPSGSKKIVELEANIRDLRPREINKIIYAKVYRAWIARDPPDTTEKGFRVILLDKQVHFT